MKELFASYYQLSDEGFTKLWAEGIFILDANILLDAYRLPEGARDDLFKILESIKDRLWVPFQAALEYQENRLGEVAKQKQVFNKVQSVIDRLLPQLKKEFKDLQLEKRHSLINTKPFIKGIQEECEKFSKKLNTLKERQPDVCDEDLIRDQIDSLLKGKIGTPPNSQDVLDQWYTEGKERFDIKMPPGYKDAGKNGGYFYKNMRFEKKYADLMLWKQIIKEVQDSKYKYVVFITNDDKEDWWQEINGKKIGTRRELIDELTTETKVSLFHMYNLERFMFYSEKHLSIVLDDDSIEQVKDVVAMKQVSEESVLAIADEAVLNWLHSTEDTSVVTDVGINEFIVLNADRSHDYVKVISIEKIPSQGMQDLMNYWAHGYKSVSSLPYDHVTIDHMVIVVATTNKTLVSKITDILDRREPMTGYNLDIHIGIVKYSPDGFPYYHATVAFNL